MRGRLSGLFILIVILSVANSQNMYGQHTTTFHSLTTKQRKSTKKQIKLMSIEEKILAFSCLQTEAVGSYPDHVGAVMFNQTEAYPASKHNINFFNTYGLIYQGVPFPATRTIELSNLNQPGWLPAIFSADYILDIDVASTNALYYGLDTTGITNTVTPYFSWSDLSTSLIRHDFIYSTDSAEIWLDRFIGKTDSRFLKQLNEKLQISISTKILYPQNHKLPVYTKKKALKSIWEVYNSSISSNANGLYTITNPDSLNICSFVFSGNFNNFNKTLLEHANIVDYKAEDLNKNDMLRLSAYDLVIIPVVNISDKQRDFIKNLSLHTHVLLVQFDPGTSELIEIENVRLVFVPENNTMTQILAAEKLFAIDNRERGEYMLIHGVPELVGISSDTLSEMDHIIEEAIRGKAIPGCQVLVAKDGYVVWNKAYGYQTYDSLTEVTENTIYDLASITKVLATTQGIMFLLDQKMITLDDTLSMHLPYLIGTNKQNTTIRQILAHQANLYPYYSFWKRAKENLIDQPNVVKNIQVGKSLWVNKAVGDSILMWAAQSELLSERIDSITQVQYLYSDIGFYLLKDLIERKTEQNFDTFLAQKLYAPMGTKLVFNPTCYFPTSVIAPTEYDTKLRHEQVRGFVHDRNAALLGGVGGQAGLFGNAFDVAQILQLQLNGGRYGGKKYYNSSTVEQFLGRQYDNNRRALGWDRPGPEPDGPVSLLASDDTFGHTGFTGGSIWADPKENLIFVFLSNRVYPSAENTKLIDMNIRTRVQDIVYRSVIKPE